MIISYWCFRFNPNHHRHISLIWLQPTRLRRPHLLLEVTATTPGKDSCCKSSDL